MKFVLLITILFLGVTASSQAVQNPQTPQGRKQRPPKNTPQYPNIISPEDKTTAPKTDVAPEAVTPVATPEFVRALEALNGELKQLVLEIRAMNVRQQAQLDMLKLTRADGLLLNYERQLKDVTQEITRLDNEEMAIRESLKPEALIARANQFGTLDRDATIRRMKSDFEARLLGIQTEKAALQPREAELRQVVESLRSSNDDTERRLILVEEALRQLSAPRPAEEKKP
jgi:hypothetical protein